MTQVPLLLDTDIGSDIDDAVCLAYLLGQPRCDLLGITTVSGQPQVRAVLADAVCQAAGRNVPIHAGTEHAILTATPQPDVPQAAVLPQFKHCNPTDFVPNTAVDFLRDTILARRGEVTLLTIGPLTNVALLFTTYPETIAALKSLVMMVGMFSHRTPSLGPREWNALCDATATAAVFRAPLIEHKSVGLDVTIRCVMDATEVIDRFATAGGALGVVAAMTEVWASERAKVVFHDPLAGACVFKPELCEWTTGTVDVELVSKRFRGATAFDATPDGPHQVASAVDADAFFAEFWSVCGSQ